MKDTLSLAAARRIALAAQGFADSRPPRVADFRAVRRVLRHTGLLQIDSVSAVVRAHYMPAFSRLGPYPMALIDQAAWKRPRRLFEYWAHEASLLPVEMWPYMQWRMEKARRSQGIYKGLAEFARQNRAYIERIYQEVAARGPIAASDFEDQKGSGGWWGWSEVKHALEWLFWVGRITTATRRGFERLYDLPQRVIPATIHDAPTPEPAEAIRHLLRVSARGLGVATAADLRDYFRLSPKDADPRLAELVEAGDLLPVRVEGWSQKAFLTKDARMPRRVGGQALLAPFDPLVWERSRTQRLFGFRYRIEIYTPADKRVHGYYVLPFRLGEAIVARLCLKADRAAATLRVNTAFAEPHAPAHTAEALAGELRSLAHWLGLERVETLATGDLAAPLAEALGKG